MRLVVTDGVVSNIIDGAASTTIAIGKASLSAAKHIGKKVIDNPQIKPTIDETVSIAKEAGEIAKLGVKLSVVGVAATQLSPAFALAFLPEAIDLVTQTTKNSKENKNAKNK